jgi:HipA-like protein
MLIVNKINIFSQTKSKRSFVGTLWKDKKGYHFQYSFDYTRQKTAIPLGPEFDLWKEKFTSKKMFASLLDRIPSNRNPAYIDYCQQWGIDPNEKDPLVLLSSIGRRGPSTFIFEKAIEINYLPQLVKEFRIKLGLTQSEFELLFRLSHATLIRLEQGKSTNETILTYIQMVEETPSALLWLLKTRGQYLHDNTVAKIRKFLDASHKFEV